MAALSRMGIAAAKFGSEPECANANTIGDELCGRSHDEYRANERSVSRNKCHVDQFVPIHRRRERNESDDVIQGQTAVRFAPYRRMPIRTTVASATCARCGEARVGFRSPQASLQLGKCPVLLWSQAQHRHNRSPHFLYTLLTFLLTVP